MHIIPEFSSVSPNESYRGLILTLQDALLVLEATRLNILPKVKRRLNDVERKHITAGSVFAWNETECGMKRWTDGKNWLASKVKGPFLTYQEHDDTRNVKPNGLVKQSFSLTTKQNEKLHLIAYYDPLDRAKGQTCGKVPSQNEMLAKLLFDPAIYLNDVLHYNSPDSRVAPHLRQHMVQQMPVAPVQYSQPPLTSQGSFYRPVQPAYYCHQLLMPYPYAQNGLPLPQSYPVPLLVYLHPVPQYAYEYPAAVQQVAQVPSQLQPSQLVQQLPQVPQVAQTQLLPQPPQPHQTPVLAPPLISSAPRRLSATSPSYGSVTLSGATGYFNYKPANSPAFTYGIKRETSLLSIPSPSIPYLASGPLATSLPEAGKLDVRSPELGKPFRLPSALELLLPVGLAPISASHAINKLSEPKLFSV